MIAARCGSKAPEREGVHGVHPVPPPLPRRERQPPCGGRGGGDCLELCLTFWREGSMLTTGPRVSNATTIFVFLGAWTVGGFPSYVGGRIIPRNQCVGVCLPRAACVSPYCGTGSHPPACLWLLWRKGGCHHCWRVLTTHLTDGACPRH